MKKQNKKKRERDEGDNITTSKRETKIKVRK